MKQYELLCILPGTMEESAIAPYINEVQKMIEKQGGQNVAVQLRGKSRLAYPIKHIRYGYFSVLQFEAEAEAIPEMQKELGLMRELLRSLITSYDKDARAAYQKQVGRSDTAEMKTLSSVFERFGGESDTRRTPSSTSQEATPTPSVEEKKEAAAPAKEQIEKKVKEPTEEATLKIEDIDKKLDQLLEEDLKSV